jgi:predicted DNA-binding transcriptional regulator YafY
VLAALPAELRTRASRLVERFHLDAGAWFRPGEPVPHLAALASAVWEGRRVSIAYQRGDRDVERTLDPLGLVLKAGTWYLVAVAVVPGEVRTYRVSRVRRVTASQEPAQRPGDFDLATYWAEAAAAYERDVPTVSVSIRIDPRYRGMLGELVGERAMRGAERLPDADDPDGWRHLRLELDWPDEAPARLLALGDHVEVLEPPEVRRQVVKLATGALRRHEAVPEPLLEPVGVS